MGVGVSYGVYSCAGALQKSSGRGVQFSAWILRGRGGGLSGGLSGSSEGKATVNIVSHLGDRRLGDDTFAIVLSTSNHRMTFLLVSRGCE